MTVDMVLLNEVEQQAEAATTIAMLDAYGIHAVRSGHLTSRGWYGIYVNEIDLDSARSLLTRAAEPDEAPAGKEPPSFAELTVRPVLLPSSVFSSGEVVMSRYGLLHTLLLMCAGAIIGSALARLFCGRCIDIYSRKAVMVALVAYYTAGPIWLLFRYASGDPETSLLQVAPGLCIVISSLVFWPADIERGRMNVAG